MTHQSAPCSHKFLPKQNDKCAKAPSEDLATDRNDTVVMGGHLFKPDTWTLQSAPGRGVEEDTR